MAFQVAKPENYWISPKALNIQLNAMGDADYIQASVAAGATILCYVNGVEGLEFDVGHNYNHWPLTISPTYFPTTTRKYVYVAIPRTEQAGTDAMVVFPSEKLDIYGKNEAGDQVGDADKYYIWLQGIISGYMEEYGRVYRDWEAPLHTGLLNSDESYKAGGEDSWWIWDAVSDTVTFLKKIAYAVFEYLKADQAEVGALTVTGRSDLNEVHISGPAYGDHFQSSHYTGDGMFDSGFLLRYADGHAKLVIDDLVCRGKFTVNEIEDRIWTYSGGNLVFSSAGSTIHYVEYLDENDEPLGYTYINSRWLLAGIRLLARRYPWARKKLIQRSLTPAERSQVRKFRCYETSDNGTMQTRNWWHIDDIAFCQTLNRVKNKTVRSGEYSGSLSNTVYARRVINIGSKKIEFAEDNLIYDYVDLSLTDHEAGYDDWPMAGDIIVQRGNFTDTSRQGLTTIEVTGDQRGLKVYDGFNSYSKDGKQKCFLGYDADLKRGLLEVFGDCYIGAMGDTAEDVHNGSTFIRYNSSTKVLDIKAKISILSTIGNQSIPDYIHDNTWSEEQIEQMIGDDISVVQKQLDGNFTIYYGTDYPSTSNYPANEWTTTALKEEHLYDLFYDKVHDVGWRWTKSVDGRGHVTYGWMRIGDSSILASLRAAADAQDTADGKRRVFITAANVLPTPPYDEGDLWTNATYGLYTNEILRCSTPKAAGATASINDWAKASKYTDDSSLNTFLAGKYAQDITGLKDTDAETKVEVHSAAWWAQWSYAKAEFYGNIDAATVKGPLDSIASDGVVKSDEKWKITSATGSESSEYSDAIAAAAEVGVDTTAFTAAYNAMLAAVAKYTAASPADIPVESDYQNIYAYFQAKANLYNQIGDKWHDVASTAKSTAESANAKADAMQYLKVALGQKTDVEGGLILTSLIALRDGSDKVWSGINGVFNSSLRGNGIAAWYGGGMIDHEAYPSTGNFAKTLFRMDGTGYMAGGKISWNADGSGNVAGGNVSWDANGNVTIAGNTISTTNFTLDGTNIDTTALSNLLTMFTFETVSGTKSIKALFPLFTVSDLSARSDMRQKNIYEDFQIDIHKIANTRLIKFTWKDKSDELNHAGAIAQEWEKILPEAVKQSADGTLMMDYGAIGVASAVSLARKVVEQQQRISSLEERIAKLEQMIYNMR